MRLRAGRRVPLRPAMTALTYRWLRPAVVLTLSVAATVLLEAIVAMAYVRTRGADELERWHAVLVPVYVLLVALFVYLFVVLWSRSFREKCHLHWWEALFWLVELPIVLALVVAGGDALNASDRGDTADIGTIGALAILLGLVWLVRACLIAWRPYSRDRFGMPRHAGAAAAHGDSALDEVVVPRGDAGDDVMLP